MSIQRKPNVGASQREEAFIAGAPDAKTTPAAARDDYSKGIKKGDKRQISLTMAPHLLRRVDEVAQRIGQSRAAIINLAVSRALDGDFFK